jgi:hypothetical protein|tara:strand:+ start:29 stop:862 length:834 start_codon:yes stop_codon:yes gene_type:complete
MKKHLIKEITRQREIMGLIGEQRVIYTDDSDYGDYLDNCARFKFDSGRSEIDPDGDINFEEIKKSLSVGMETDRPFLKITVSTSGTGGASDNQRVMDARINEALNLILDQMDGIEGPNGLPYTAEHIKSKAKIERVYGTDNPEEELDTGEMVPTDPNHSYHRDQQFITMCFLDVGDTPGYGSLADQFVKVTMEKTGTNEDVVYDILDQLRDERDFIEFDDELRRDYGMGFYEIACDAIEVDLNPFAKGNTKGPAELGMGDTTINAHLRRLGVKPIEC